MNNKVVYAWLANSIPFYIGIGNPKRAYTYGGRNLYSTNRRLKAERENCFEVRILHENLSWKEACEIEISLISLYGRVDKESGILTNMTDGGEGATSPSKETRRKMSEANRGKTPWIKGRTHRKETRKKISEKLKDREISNVTRNKLSEINKGKTLSNEHKRKISEAHKGKTVSHETKEKMKRENTKKVKTPLGIFRTCQEAANSHEKSKGCIRRRVRSKNFSEYTYYTG